MNKVDKEAYWKEAISFTIKIMVLWFFFGFIPPIFMVDTLNTIHMGGFPLGFWFAHNGSIYAFWAMTLWYALGMRKLDEKYGVAE